MSIKLYLTKDNHRPSIKSAANYFLDQLLSTQLKRNLTISINARHELGDNYGLCEWLDHPYKPRKFKIHIAPSLGTQLTLITIAHEFVHIRQFARAELYQSTKKYGYLNYKGSFYSRENLDVDNSPWEIEARELANILYKKFLIINKKKRA